jgi:hypothetical protein
MPSIVTDRLRRKLQDRDDRAAKIAATLAGVDEQLAAQERRIQARIDTLGPVVAGVDSRVAAYLASRVFEPDVDETLTEAQAMRDESAVAAEQLGDCRILLEPFTRLRRTFREQLQKAQMNYMTDPELVAAVNAPPGATVSAYGYTWIKKGKRP